MPLPRAASNFDPAQDERGVGPGADAELGGSLVVLSIGVCFVIAQGYPGVPGQQVGSARGGFRQLGCRLAFFRVTVAVPDRIAPGISAICTMCL